MDYNDVTDEVILLSRVAGHFVKLGSDHIHHFTSDPQRSVGEIKFGFLSLHVQVFIQGDNAWVKPNNRPGEAVAPPAVEIEDKVVDFGFPADSGLQWRLEMEGYRLSWCLETRLARAVEMDGWKVVVEKTQSGRLCRYRVKDPRVDQVLLKKSIR